MIPSSLGIRRNIHLAQGHARKVNQKGRVAVLKAEEIPVCPERLQHSEMVENRSGGRCFQRANKQFGVVITLRLRQSLSLFFTQTETAGVRVARPGEAD